MGTCVMMMHGKLFKVHTLLSTLRHISGAKRGLVVSKRLIEVYIWLVVKCVNMIRASCSNS